MDRRTQNSAIQGDGAPAQEAPSRTNSPGYQACPSTRRAWARKPASTCLPRLVARGCPDAVPGILPNEGGSSSVGRLSVSSFYARCVRYGRPTGE